MHLSLGLFLIVLGLQTEGLAATVSLEHEGVLPLLPECIGQPEEQIVFVVVLKSEKAFSHPPLLNMMINIGKPDDFFLVGIAMHAILRPPFNSLKGYLHQLLILLSEVFLPMHSQKVSLAHKPDDPLVDYVPFTLLPAGCITGMLGFEGGVDHIHVLMDDLALRLGTVLFLGLVGGLWEVIRGALIYIGVDLQCVVVYFLGGFGLIDLDLHFGQEIVEGIGRDLVGSDHLLAAFFHMIQKMNIQGINK